MSLRALRIRLEKLEASNPAPIESGWQPSSTLAQDLADIIESSKRYSTLSPKQKIAESRAALREEIARESRPLPYHPVSGLVEKLQKVRIGFRDIYEEQIRAAELELLAELGHTKALHPLSPEFRELLNHALLDL